MAEGWQMSRIFINFILFDADVAGCRIYSAFSAARSNFRSISRIGYCARNKLSPRRLRGLNESRLPVACDCGRVVNETSLTVPRISERAAVGEGRGRMVIVA